MRSFTITKAVRVFVLSSLLFFGVGLPQAMASCTIVLPPGCIAVCYCSIDGHVVCLPVSAGCN
jgi:hypothetical protein